MKNLNLPNKPKATTGVVSSDLVKTRQLCVLCVEELPVGWTEDAEWAVAWQNQLHCRYIKMLPEIVRAES